MVKAPSRMAVLAALPHREPFRFLDEIVSLDEERIVVTYRFRDSAPFYRGHFPGNPVTPAALLIEAMVQAAVVAHSVYLLAGERTGPKAMPVAGLLTEANVEFQGIVRPGERMVIEGRKLFFRCHKLRSAVEMRREDGTVVCRGTLAGMAVAP